MENREEESIGDRGEEWREEGVEYERECTLYSTIGRRRVEEKVEHSIL